MAVKTFTDLYSQIEKISANESDYADNSTNFGVGIKSANEALEVSFGDINKRNEAERIIMSQINTKLVRTQDFGTMRLPTVSSVMEEKRNEYTPWLNFLESQPGGFSIAEDFEYQWNIYDIGTDGAAFIDHQTSIGSEVKSSYIKDSNTVGCLAVKVVMSDLAMNMMQRQRNINILNKEVGAAVTRIRNTMESVLLSNTEVIMEGPTPIPQPGGFLSRSTVNVQNLSSNDFTAPFLRGMISDIAQIAAQNGRGYRQLALLTNEQQCQVIRDIIVNENNGIFPTDRVAFESYLMKRMSDINVPVTTVFESLLGPSVPAILVPRLPANTSILFETALPRLVKMILGDAEGPYAAMRPNELFQRVEVILDFISLEDSLRSTRRVFDNVNS